MIEFVFAHLEHVLCGLILVSRAGDIGTTYLVTPSLALEANPIVRRLGWTYGLLTLVVCLVPYYSVEAGIMMLVPSLLVSASNAGKVWAARTMGERRYREMMLSLAAASRLRHALAALYLSAGFIVLLGVVLVVLYPDPGEDYAYWFGAGIVAYGLVITVHGSLALHRLFREAKTAVDTPTGGARS